MFFWKPPRRKWSNLDLFGSEASWWRECCNYDAYCYCGRFRFRSEASDHFNTKNFESHEEITDFTCYESGEAFLEAFHPGLFNAVFMDIMLAKNGLNGIETAEKLRTVAARIPLIFVSNERDYSLEGYLSHPALWLRSALSGRNYWCKRVWQIFKEETLFTDGSYHSEAGW